MNDTNNTNLTSFSPSLLVLIKLRHV